MNSLTNVLRANPGIIVTLALFAGTLFVLALVGLLMRGAGASLRPIVFLAGTMLTLGLTLFVVELVRARQPGTTPTASFTLPVRNGQFTDCEKLFGADLFAREALQPPLQSAAHGTAAARA